MISCTKLSVRFDTEKCITFQFCVELNLERNVDSILSYGDNITKIVFQLKTFYHLAFFLIPISVWKDKGLCFHAFSRYVGRCRESISRLVVVLKGYQMCGAEY